MNDQDDAMIERIKHREVLRETQRRFYVEFLPKIVGKKFYSLRTYGYAEYEIIGDRSAWKSSRDTECRLFHYENGRLVFTGNQVHSGRTLCIAVKRLGGYEGEPKSEPLETILARFLNDTDQ